MRIVHFLSTGVLSSVVLLASCDNKMQGTIGTEPSAEVPARLLAPTPEDLVEIPGIDADGNAVTGGYATWLPDYEGPFKEPEPPQPHAKWLIGTTNRYARYPFIAFTDRPLEAKKCRAELKHKILTGGAGKDVSLQAEIFVPELTSKHKNELAWFMQTLAYGTDPDKKTYGLPIVVAGFQTLADKRCRISGRIATFYTPDRHPTWKTFSVEGDFLGKYLVVRMDIQYRTANGSVKLTVTDKDAGIPKTATYTGITFPSLKYLQDDSIVWKVGTYNANSAKNTYYSQIDIHRLSAKGIIL